MILTQSTDSVIYYNQTFMNNSSSHFFILQVVKRNIPFDIKLSLNSYKKIKYTESKITNNRMLFFILFLFKKFKNSIYTFTENLNFSEDRFKFFLEWSLCIRKYDYWHKMKVFYLDSDYQLKNISKLFLTNKKLLKSSKKIFLYFKSSSIFKYHRYKLLKFFKKKFTHNYEKYIYNRIFHSFLNAKYLAFYKISKFLSKDMNLDMT
ncbi:hypothetical protein CPARA_2gp242 (nucleomorph) [Cryptomonas paramecium]|uniref:Uncharacterized protein n=1 Tax=Cryptomonas paramaecium TaxID=2898 RepID=F2HHV4_9CRYP|nr:hypothetical protein CPARA_2gp242 [Cryptomonas paramecium]AEA38900.1 hypothetical protein CPARA_2gp242 [Cryptomonas paramecium]